MIYHTKSKQCRIKYENIMLMKKLGITNLNDFLFQKLNQDCIEKDTQIKK
jgi:hypothetical protein